LAIIVSVEDIESRMELWGELSLTPEAEKKETISCCAKGAAHHLYCALSRIKRYGISGAIIPVVL
jgi:hypothetical protein